MLTQTDLEKEKRNKEREKYIKSLEQIPVTASKPSSSSKQKPPSSYSRKTSRLNEELRTGRRTSRGSLASRQFLSAANKQFKYIVDENEREVWVCVYLANLVNFWLLNSLIF